MVMDSVKYAVGGTEEAVTKAVNEVREFINLNGGNNPDAIGYFDGQFFMSGDGLYGMEYVIGDLPVIVMPEPRSVRNEKIHAIFTKYIGNGLDWFRPTV